MFGSRRLRGTWESQILSGEMPMPATAGRAYHGKITLSSACQLLREAQNISGRRLPTTRILHISGYYKKGVKTAGLHPNDIVAVEYM